MNAQLKVRLGTVLVCIEFGNCLLHVLFLYNFPNTLAFKGPFPGSSGPKDWVSFEDLAVQAAALTALLLSLELWWCPALGQSRTVSCSKVKENKITWEVHLLFGHFSKFWLSSKIHLFFFTFQSSQVVAFHVGPRAFGCKRKRERLQCIYPSREELECPTFLCFMKDHAHQRGEYVMMVNRTCMYFPKSLQKRSIFC